VVCVVCPRDCSSALVAFCRTACENHM
jgi:hypothetical protein